MVASAEILLHAMQEMQKGTDLDRWQMFLNKTAKVHTCLNLLDRLLPSLGVYKVVIRLFIIGVTYHGNLNGSKAEKAYTSRCIENARLHNAHHYIEK